MMRIESIVVILLLCGGIAMAEINGKCSAAARHLSQHGRTNRIFFIPAIEHNDAGETITGNAGCMVTQAGWWTYEFCFGDFVRQFHAENGKIHDEYFIGLSGNVFDKQSNANAILTYKNKGSTKIATRIKEAGLGKASDPSAPQYQYVCDLNVAETLLNDKENGVVALNHYDGGSHCANGKQRSATIFYICDTPDPSKKMPIFFDISESEPCTYQLFVRGPKMCDLMSVKEPTLPSNTKESTTNIPALPEQKGGAATQPDTEEQPAKAETQDVKEYPAILNDEHMETWESLPQSATKNQENLFYPLGLDDEAFFEDSFIMSV